MRVRSIGLSGGIGSGKSTVASALVDCGAWLVDTDAIARSLTAPGGAALQALVDTFGPQVIGTDGALDRNHMRALAFSDPGAKLRLEAVLHPLIGLQATRRAAQADGRVLVFDVPLLTESRHWRARVERILIVDCDEATQIRRVVERSGWSEADVRKVLAQQAPRHARRAIADAVIHNEALSLEALRSEVEQLWQQWCAIAVEQ